MSNTINNQIPLTQIIAPSLSDVNYASGLNDVFDNINDNFSTLSNHDFIKGESGTSVKIQEDKFFNEDGSLTVLGKKLQYCILSLSNNEDEYADVIDGEGNHITVFDYFKANPGVLYMIYNTVNDVNIQTPVAISSLYYVFLDGRYATTKMGMIDESQYTNIKDFSCVLVYDANIKSIVDDKEVNGGFKALTTAFPTIYYESNIGLCWKVNGNGTGIPVQGVPGRNGLDTNLQIVKGSSPKKTESNQIVSNITSLYGLYDGFIEFDPNEDYSYLHGKAALILTPNVNTANDNSFYFGMLEVKGDVGSQEVRAYCDQSTSIDYSMAAETMINVMKNINIVGGDIAHNILPGLFIPMENRGDNSTQKVHLMAATSLTNTEGQSSDLKTDLMYTPISDINNFDISGADDEGNQLIVDKYLYVKLNENSNYGYTYTDATSSDDSVIDIIPRKYSGYLKYKLVNVINNIDSPYMNFFSFDNSSLSSIGGSKLKPAVSYRNIIQYVQSTNSGWNNNYIYCDEGSSNEILTPNGGVIPFYKDITQSDAVNINFKTTNGQVAYDNRLDDDNKPYIAGNTPIINDVLQLPDAWFIDKYHTQLRSSIYRWVLCDKIDDFDIEELKNNESIIGDFIDEGIYRFDVPAFKNFAVILTNTMSPTADSDLMWYNSLYVTGITVDGAAVYVGNGRYEDRNPSSVIVAGWDSSVMQFVKFVPIYRNDYAVDTDTSFNINYNVNITGDSKNSRKSLTVHGGINCDDLNVYSLTATGEIKNIYTKNDIVGDKGIYLGYQVDTKDAEDAINDVAQYNLKINSSGEIDTKGSIIIGGDASITGDMTVDDITASSLCIMGSYNTKKGDLTGGLLFETKDTKPIVNIVKTNKTYDYYDSNNSIKLQEHNVDCLDIDIKHINSLNLSTEQVKYGNENSNQYDPIATINSNIPINMYGNAPIILSNAGATYVCPNLDQTNGTSLKDEGHMFSDVWEKLEDDISKTSYDKKENIVFDNNEQYYENGLKPSSIKCNTSSKTHKIISSATDEHCISIFTINKNDLATDKDISIKFDKALDFQIGVNGENFNGSNPQLDGTNSFIQMRVFINDNDKTKDLEIGLANFPGMSMITNSYSWSGDWVGNGGISSWRLYTFVYYPPVLNIPTKLLKDGENTVKIAFDINVKVYCDKGTWGVMDALYGIVLRRPTFSSKNNDDSGKFNFNKDKHYNIESTDYIDAYKKYKTLPMSGSYLAKTAEAYTDDFRGINIMNDGIIFKGTGKLFGLSFSKYDQSNNGWLHGGEDIYMHFADSVGSELEYKSLKLKDLMNVVNNVNAYGL